MRGIWVNRWVVLGTLVVTGAMSSVPVMAQAPQGGSGASDVASTVYPWKKVNAQEREKACRTYEGAFISYYGEIWKVENCQRRGIRSQNAILDIVSQANSVTEVDGKIVAVIPEGKPLIDDTAPKTVLRGCKELEGRYVTHSYLDIFVVENCRKHLIPDWETYLQLKAARRDDKGEILSLSYAEFQKIAAGTDIKSVADAEFHKLMQTEKTPEVVPAKEACRGVEGQLVAYYSKLYKIENCRKREINPDDFFDQRSGLTAKVTDLTGEQWISIPDGKPMPASGIGEKPIEKTGDVNVEKPAEKSAEKSSIKPAENVVPKSTEKPKPVPAAAAVKQAP